MRDGISVGVSVRLAQIERWTDAWTDRSAAKSYLERKGNLLSELDFVLAQGESSWELRPLLPAPQLPSHSGLMNSTTNPSAQGLGLENRRESGQRGA